jgi:hypothetical protein
MLASEGAIDAGEANDAQDRTRTADASGPGTQRTRPTSAAAKPGVAAGDFFTADRPAYKACDVAALRDGTARLAMRLPGAAGSSRRPYPPQPRPGQHLLRHRLQLQPALLRETPHGIGTAVAAPNTFTRKTDGARWLAMTEAETLAGTWIDPEAGRIPLSDAHTRRRNLTAHSQGPRSRIVWHECGKPTTADYDK